MKKSTCKTIHMLLYAVSFIGIAANMYFQTKELGMIGYACLLVASLIQITKMIKYRGR